jgi:hypothetical protein
MYEYRCDERLKVKDEGSTIHWVARGTGTPKDRDEVNRREVYDRYTGFCGGLEHLKIETRLIDERFPSVMGECVI